MVLTEEEREKLAQYQAITQLRDGEEGARQLAEHDWNIERAIQHFFDNEKRPSTPPPPAPPPPVRRTQPTRFSLFSLLFWPFGLAWNISWSILSFARRFLSRPIQDRPRHPRSLAIEFKRQFEASYGTTHLDFFEGGYSQALEKAKSELLFLLVILHSSDHEKTEQFCQETLTSPDLIQFVQDQRLLVWAGDVAQSEAHKVSGTLQATTFPFMGLIALQGQMPPKMTVIERIEGSCHPQELISQLTHAIERHGAVLHRLQNEREQRERERQLRVDQDAAYHQSLKADQEKARKQQEEQEAKAREEQERVLALEKREREAQKRSQYIQYLYAQLPPEPSSQQEGPLAKINFRLANGDRVVRQFEAKATVNTLYQFVEVYPLWKQHQPQQTVEAPTDYQHQYQFTLHTTFPRTEFPPDTTPLMDIPSLWPSATLVVEENEDQ
ncbi:thioredoxin-like protein [Blakeslea trispora]|nr:thioredoxin-like protein [Blakeslea trispora]